MELQALLVLGGVGVAVVAVVLLMGLFSASGTSYEEAIAQQRKATTELLALAENKEKTKKNSKKAIKKLAKKEKNREASNVTTGSEAESEVPAESSVDEDVPVVGRPHVEFSPPVVVDVPRDSLPNVKIRKRGKDPKVKPILINKEDPSCINDPSTPPSPSGSNVSNHFEEIHPKDEFELLISSLAADKASEKNEELVEKKVVIEKKEAAEKKEGKAGKHGKGGKAASKQPATTEAAKEEGGREGRGASEGAKEQRKGKKSEKKPTAEEVQDTSRETGAATPSESRAPAPAADPPVAPAAPAPAPAAASGPAAAPAPNPAPANVTPPGGGRNKKKKAEPNVLSLMAGDSGGVSAVELVRVVRDAVLSRDEIQILTEALLNKHHDPLPEHSEWTEGPNDPVQKLKKQLAEKEKTLVEEKEASNALQAKLKELRASLNAERSGAAAAKRAAEQAAAEAHALQARLDQLLERNRELAQESHVAKLAVEAEAQSHKVQLEMHVQRFHESEASYLQQLNGHRSELAVLVGELGQARCEAAAARDAAALAQQHAAELAQQLQDVTRAFSELEQQRLASAHDEQRSREAHAAVVNDLQKRVHELTAQLQAAESGAHALKEDAQRAVEEKQQLVSEIASQREQLALLQTELSELKQLKAMPSQNGLLAAEVDDNGRHKMGELEKVQSALEQLRGELAAARRDLAERTELLQRARDQLQHYQDKNNELRTKNWKVMEALQSAEKALQTKTATAPPARHAQRDGIIEEVANVLRSVCPEAEPEPLAGGVSLSWLRAFAENVPRELRLDDLRKQNVQLQEQADKYKQIIDETDGMLTSLQKNAAESEYGWVQKFAAHEKLIDELRARIDSQGDEVGRLRNTLSEEEHRWAQQLAAKQRELDELRAQKDTQGDEVGRLRNTLSEEEHRWAQQLAAKQRELDELRAQKDTQMQTKIESLETDLKREQATNHSQSFAEAERTTEERLMSVLSEKLKVDSKNGPSKTELEKI